MTKKYTQESVKTAEPSKTALTIVEGPLPNAQFQKDHESTAGIDRKIFFLRCQGHSFHKIAQILNEDGGPILESIKKSDGFLPGVGRLEYMQ